MEDELISEEDYESLPEGDPEERFVRFEAICRRNMNRLLSKNSRDAYYGRTLNSQYMALVSGVASECGFANLTVTSIPGNDEQFYDEFNDFSLRVQGEVARIRFRGQGLRHPYSVQISNNTRQKIDFHLSNLRQAINDSKLPEHRKKMLNGKLDEFLLALSDRRMSFGKAFALLGPILLGLGTGTQIAAEGPQAISNIMKLLTLEKKTEDAARVRLQPPPKALPAPSPGAPGSIDPWTPPNHDLDDELPF